MPYLSEIENDYVLGDLKVFREFDISHFISNARTALSGKAEIVKLDDKFNYYTSTLERAINSFQNIIVDSERIKNFLGNYSDIDTSNIMMNDVNSLDVITIRPQYIGQYTNMVGDVINAVLKGNDTIDTSGYLSGEYPLKVRRQVVKTTLPFAAPTKELIKISKHTLVPVNDSYVKTKVIPFVNNYKNLQHDTITEATATLNAIKEAEITMKGMIKVLNKRKLDGSIPSDKLNKVNQISYNAIRGILDIVSYTTYMTIRKLNIVSSNILACNKLYNSMSNLVTSKEPDDVTEAFTDIIIPTDTNSLAEDFIAGNTGAFEDLANRIYSFHSDIPGLDTSEMMPTLTDKNLADMELGQYNFNAAPYKEAYKIFDSINGGLDTIAAASDDYLMVFDDIIKEAGFLMRLEDRYKTYIDALDDVSEYRSGSSLSGITNSGNKMVFLRLLAEIKNYPELVSSIANICLETKTKLDMLLKRFASNINGEFKDAEAVNELKVFLSDLVDQYQKITILISGKLMHRLRLMGNILAELESSDESDMNQASPIAIDTDSTVDFSEGFRDAMYDEVENNTKAIMEHLELEYYSARMKLRNGVDVIYEADAVQPSTTNATGNKEQTTNASTVSVQDNTPAPAPQPGTPEANNIDVSGKFKTQADNFIAKVNKKAAKNKGWIDDNLDNLQSRSFSNVSINRINTNFDDQATIKSLNALADDITSLAKRPSDLQAIQTLGDVPGKLGYNELAGLNADAGIEKQASNYFTTGSVTDPQTQNIANGELKTLVLNKILPRAKAFYPSDPKSTDGTSNGIKDAVYRIGDAMSTLKAASVGTAAPTTPGNSTATPASTPAPTNQPSGGTQSPTPASTSAPQQINASVDVDDISNYSIFAEADAVKNVDAVPKKSPGNVNTKASLKSAYALVDKFVSAIVGGAMNARYNVNNGDMTTLAGLVPKGSNDAPKSNSDKKEDNEPQSPKAPAAPGTPPPSQPQPQQVNASVDYDDIEYGYDLKTENSLAEIEEFLGL